MAGVALSPADLIGHFLGMSGLAFGFCAALTMICVQGCVQSRPWLSPALRAFRIAIAVLVHLFVIASWSTLSSSFSRFMPTSTLQHF